MNEKTVGIYKGRKPINNKGYYKTIGSFYEGAIHQTIWIFLRNLLKDDMVLTFAQFEVKLSAFLWYVYAIKRIVRFWRNPNQGIMDTDKPHYLSQS